MLSVYIQVHSSGDLHSFKGYAFPLLAPAKDNAATDGNKRRQNCTE